MGGPGAPNPSVALGSAAYRLFIITPWSRYSYFPLFTAKETAAQRLSYLPESAWLVNSKPGFDSRQSDLKTCTILNICVFRYTGFSLKMCNKK